VFLVVLDVFANWFLLFLVKSSGALPTNSVDFHQICSFFVVLVILVFLLSGFGGLW
jgi:hypothetical protein